ncbi:MAG: ATP-binding protein [Spirulina sp.]
MAVASAEFIALCQSQVVLLTQSLGASSTAIYLAEKVDDGAELSLVPLVAYPKLENPWADWPESLTMMTYPGAVAIGDETATRTATGNVDRWPPDQNTTAQSSPWVDIEAGKVQGFPSPAHPGSPVPLTDAPPDAKATPPLVLPLVHEGVALGMLVSHRTQPSWGREDRQQAEQVASTLALAWILDQRGQWLQQQFQQRHLAQSSQSDTFHDLLHQFRNPLTALQTFGRLLVKRIPDGDPNQPIAEGIVRESRRLQDLAQTFDDALAQGDEALQSEGYAAPWRQDALPPALTQGSLLLPTTAGATQPDPSPGSSEPSRVAHPWGRPLQRVPGDWVTQVAPRLQAAAAIAQDRGLHLLDHLPPDLPAVWMDSSAVAEVISNLLDNALKYAPAGAAVWVVGGLSRVIDGQTCQGLAVGDTGQGIPLADQAHIFERHFRGIQASGDIPGTGLGLAIAKELMEAMGGDLEIISPVPPEYQRALAEMFDADATYQGPGVCFIAWLPQA